MIEGLSHMTFIVADLDRSERLFVDILGGQKIYDSGDETFSLSKERFYIVGGLWIALMQGESLPDKSYNHIALKIDEGDFDDYYQRIADLGLEVKPPRPRVSGEGQSIYFYDFDNHLFELHTGTLDQRLTRYTSGK